MPNDFQPTRQKSDLADVVEMLLDKGVVINADIAVSIGDTQLLGVQVRAALASFETAAKYGLEFPEGTDMRRVAEAAGEPELADEERPRPPIDATRGVNVTAESGEYGREEESAEETDEAEADSDGGIEMGRSDDDRGTERLGARPNPGVPTDDVDIFEGGPLDTDDDGESEVDADGESNANEDDDSSESADSSGDGDSSDDSADADGEEVTQE